MIFSPQIPIPSFIIYIFPPLGTVLLSRRLSLCHYHTKGNAITSLQKTQQIPIYFSQKIVYNYKQLDKNLIHSIFLIHIVYFPFSLCIMAILKYIKEELFLPRTARILSSTQTYHVVIRGADRQLLFEEAKEYLKIPVMLFGST